jgi:hypothetical protein
VAGICGPTPQALAEADLARRLGYDVGLVSLAALHDATNDELIAHCRRIGEVIPLFGFYLQPAVGGRVLDQAFWRAFLEIPAVVAVKVAPFNRYATLDVTRALAVSGRDDVALYTGNDDAIVADLVTAFPGRPGKGPVRFVGGLLGQWAVWTHEAVALSAAPIAACRRAARGSPISLPSARSSPTPTPRSSTPATGSPDASRAFTRSCGGRACSPGRWCLDPHEDLSPGQMEEIDRVCRVYPRLADDAFVDENLDRWLA